ncbi:hypothetical protein, partial [Candidatus Ichthyocystis hellenicum]|uniref:hypothetical protein n=1 Tax=Candidatus Ichthyocystis hellenicum TaxID=1561003 RepID=UPI0015857B92
EVQQAEEDEVSKAREDSASRVTAALTEVQQTEEDVVSKAKEESASRVATALTEVQQAEKDVVSKAREDSASRVASALTEVRQAEEEEVSKAKEESALRVDTALTRVRQAEEDEVSKAKEESKTRLEALLTKLKQEEEEKLSRAREESASRATVARTEARQAGVRQEEEKEVLLEAREESALAEVQQVEDEEELPETDELDAALAAPLRGMEVKSSDEDRSIADTESSDNDQAGPSTPHVDGGPRQDRTADQDPVVRRRTGTVRRRTRRGTNEPPAQETRRNRLEEVRVENKELYSQMMSDATSNRNLYSHECNGIQMTLYARTETELASIVRSVEKLSRLLSREQQRSAFSRPGIICSSSIFTDSGIEVGKDKVLQVTTEENSPAIIFTPINTRIAVPSRQPDSISRMQLPPSIEEILRGIDPRRGERRRRRSSSSDRERVRARSRERGKKSSAERLTSSSSASEEDD